MGAACGGLSPARAGRPRCPKGVGLRGLGVQQGGRNTMDNRIKGVVARAVGGLFAAVKTVGVSAQDTASAGNGGTATANANGGSVAIGDVNSGGNAGNAAGAGDTWGGVAIDAGT